MTGNAPSGKSKAIQAIAAGGLIAGTLDLLQACTLFGWDIPLFIAAGLLGPKAEHGGAGTYILGVMLHFFIAFVMALVYVRASRRLPLLTAKPLLMGVLYGVMLYVVMNFVVVPLSQIGLRPLTLHGFLRAFPPHVLFVGPAIALIAARRARTASP